MTTSALSFRVASSFIHQQKMVVLLLCTFLSLGHGAKQSRFCSRADMLLFYRDDNEGKGLSYLDSLLCPYPTTFYLGTKKNLSTILILMYMGLCGCTCQKENQHEYTTVRCVCISEGFMYAQKYVSHPVHVTTNSLLKGFEIMICCLGTCQAIMLQVRPYTESCFVVCV